MKSRARVVWEEGMYLGPHQFQAQARWVEDTLTFVAAALCPFQFGFTGYELDANALRNGTVSLLHARGIFPDGTAFHIAEHKDLPPVRSIETAFKPTASSVTVSLAIPLRRVGGANLGVRYLEEKRTLPDENLGGDERPVKVARGNVRLLFDTDGDAAETDSVLPLARVRRDGSGHFVYDAEFIPPCLQTSASPTLMRVVERLIEILQAKSSALMVGQSRARNYSDNEIETFWRRHAVNSALTPLLHEFNSKRGHPETLFVELARLAGALCTFALDSDPALLPAYDHLNPGPGFFALDAHIRRILDIIVNPPNYVSIPLRRTVEHQWAGEIADTRCLGRSDWVLGIRSSVGEMPLIAKVPQLVKVCSERFVEELVRRGFPGLALRHLPLPPGALPVRSEMQYFSVSKEGPCWQTIVQTKAVGIYAPGDSLPDAEPELHVLLDA